MTRGRWHIVGNGVRRARIMGDDCRVYTLTIARTARKAYLLTITHAGRTVHEAPTSSLTEAQQAALWWSP